MDFEKDANYCFYRLFKGKDPAGIEKRLNSKKIDRNLYKEVLNEGDENKRKEMFIEYLRAVYDKKGTELRETAEEYNALWQNKQELFFRLIEERTETKWRYETYDFFVSAFFSRASWGGRGFAVWCERGPRKYFHLNGYELCLSHHFEVIDNLFPRKRPLENIKIWALAEIAAWFLVYEEKQIVEKCFPHLLGCEIKMRSYPQLMPIMKKLRNGFKTKNYLDWTKEGLELIENYPVKYLLEKK